MLRADLAFVGEGAMVTCKSALRLGISMVLLVAVLAGCGGNRAPTAATRPAEWNVLLSEATGGADVLSEYGTNSQYNLQWHIMEPLLDIELLPDGKSWGVVNILAESWSFPNPTTFRVELKKGIR